VGTEGVALVPVSTTKLLDPPYGLCDNIEVQFWCETWAQFDKTVAWLVANGVPLGQRDPDETLKINRVFMNGTRPYIKGTLVNKDHGQSGYVTGEENDITYEVQMPDVPRG
jgi:hypothetical protein